MTAPCVRRSTCRLCGSDELACVLALTPTPPANAFVPQDRRDQPQAEYPLDLWFCRTCAHLQLLDVVDPRELFETYVYVSGTSPVFVEHFRQYAAYMADSYGLKPDALVVEIGSNDGTLLSAFAGHGLRVLGVDPAKELARRATEAGIETLAQFFTPETAAAIRASHGPASCIAANNVLAHIDDLGAVMDGVAALLADDGVLVFEVSYLLDVYEKTLFDTIYHEHLDYHSVLPLQSFLARHDLELIDAQRVGTHGGSLRAVAQRRGGPHAVRPGVDELIALERAAGLHDEQTFRAFGQKIDRLGAELKSLVRGLKADGKRIAGYGAPAKATTLLYHFGLGPDELDYIVDDSPLKQGLFSPGQHIPVLSSSELQVRPPDYLLILAWNFAEAIMANNADFARNGGHFIVPVPNLVVN